MSDDFEMEVVESSSLEDGPSDEGTGQPSPSEDSSSSFLVGTLPNEWEAHRLDDVCQVNPESFSQDSHEADEFEYISLSDATDGVVTNTESIPVEEAPSRATRKVREGDVLVGTVRPKQSSHGFATEEHDGKVCSSGFGVLRTDGHVNSQYLRQEVLSRRFFRQMMAYVAGSGYPAVKLSDLEKHRIALPPLPEQRKIASVLHAVDQALHKTEEIIEQTKRLKQGLVQDLIVDRDSEKFEVFRLKEVISNIKGGYAFKSSQYSKKGIPLVQTKNFANRDDIKPTGEFKRIPKSIAKERGEYVLSGGELLISMVGSNGEVCMIPENMNAAQNQNIWRLETKENVKKEYLMHLLYGSKKKIKRAERGSTRVFLGKNEFKNLKMPIPPIELQKEICNKLKHVSLKIDVEKDYKEQLEVLKRGLMQDLLTGEVRTMNKAIEVLGEVKAHG